MTDSDTSQRQHRPRRIELSTVVKLEPENYLDEDGHVDEQQMTREALAYGEEAAQEGAFDVEMTPIEEIEE